MKVLSLIVGLLFASLRYGEAQELLAPNAKIAPERVVEIQLTALQQNDNPSVDAGILQAWRFAHPDNKRYTGPFARFAAMVKNSNYNIMLNHLRHDINNVVVTENYALFEVKIVSEDGNNAVFNWELMKANTGTFVGAWMTTAVSPPIKAKGSI